MAQTTAHCPSAERAASRTRRRFGAPDQFVLCGRTGDHDRSGAAVRTVVANRCAEREAAAEVKNDVAEHADAAVGSGISLGASK